MIKTLTPYSTSKTEEIMSRYRPIAPKPDLPTDDDGAMSQKIRDSPYLRNIWPQLQARPTRSRKRGRASIFPATGLKKPLTHFLGLSSPCHLTSPAKTLPLQQGLLLLPCPATIPVPVANTSQLGVPKFDLNTVAEVPVEKDLLKQLQGGSAAINVIAPQPIRPVASSIRVGCIREDLNLPTIIQLMKIPEEVEEEVESDVLPVIISDSSNKVRMANSAYKELVGQAECPWLEEMVGCSRCKRINGEVMLRISDSLVLPVSSNGFSCWVRIEWGRDGKRDSINTFCDVKRLSCETKDYLFVWRFHTKTEEAK